MREFPSIERVNEILTELADKIPAKYYEGLSGGIILLPQAKMHQEAINDDLYILGEYKRTPREKQIKIYYGSFEKVYKYAREDTIVEKLDEVLKHELTHHLEYNAGLKDLIDQDDRDVENYKKRYN